MCLGGFLWPLLVAGPSNDALKAAPAMSRDVENTLLISDDEIMAKADPELKVLLGAWALVPPTQFKGQLWPGAKSPKAYLRPRA